MADEDLKKEEDVPAEAGAPADEAAEAPEDAAPAGAPEEAPEGFTFFQMLQPLPSSLKNYLLSRQISAKREEIYKKFGLNEEEEIIALHTELEVFFGDAALEEFPDRLFSAMPWKDEDEEKARQLAIEILGRVFLPAQAYIGDVAKVIEELGGDVTSFPSEVLEMRTVTYAQGSQEIADAIAAEGIGTDNRKRLAGIIESKLRGVRDDTEAVEMLMKSKKTGGMELAKEQAERVLEVVKNRSRMEKFVEYIEEEKAAEPKKVLTAAEIKAIYAGPKEEQAAIQKRIIRFKEVTGGEILKMREAFYQVLFPPDLRPTDPLYVVAGLVTFAEDGSLPEILSDDDRYKNVVRSYLADNGKEAEIPEFEERPRDPKHMNLFLQLLLRGIAVYDEDRSARYALRVINALKKTNHPEYDGLVVFDMDKGAFRWTAPVPLPTVAA